VKTLLRRAFARVHVLAYRITGGRLGGSWGKAGILLLTTRGRKTSKERTTPVLYLEDSGRYVVVGTNDGAKRHPLWYLNLATDGRARVQMGGRWLEVTGRTASGPERAELWPRLVAIYRNYERDQARTERELPVVLLEQKEAP
jgi:deazaflavin-dependent oxidoreductase (nitroreductase family)